jgi:hypothetical protein
MGMGMDELRAAVEGLDVRPDGVEITSLLVLIDRLKGRLASAVGEFDALGMWELDGASSMKAWLRHHSRMTGGEAQRLAVVSRSLQKLPGLTDGLWAGSVSWGQTEVVIHTLGSKLIDAFSEGEAKVAVLLADLDMEETTVLALRIKAALEDGPLPKDPTNTFHLSSTFAGRHVGDLDLDAESGTALATAIRQAMTPDLEGEEPRPPAERRADALNSIVGFYLDNHDAKPDQRHRPHVNVVIEARDLEPGGSGIGHVVDTGEILPRSSVEALLCDCALHKVVRSGSNIVDFGVATRSISTPLWNALAIRDQQCRFPGCDRPPSWCEGHHVVWYSKGGRTNLSNLVMLCRRHHRMLHKPGWSARLDDDANFEVTDPKDVVRVTHPPWWTQSLLA